jgi:hypothetical protein
MAGVTAILSSTTHRAVGFRLSIHSGANRPTTLSGEWLSHVAHQGIVVTSDRALADTLERLGADVMDSKAFGERLQAALQGGERGKDRDSDPDTGGQTHGSRQRKGRARHPSRAARQRDHKLRNL